MVVVRGKEGLKRTTVFASREALPFSFTLWRPGLDVILFLSAQLLDSL